MRLGWVIAYSAGLFVASVVALPCWNTFLRDSVGRLLTIEQLHVIEYAGLGALAGFACRGTARSWRRVIGLGMTVVGVGFLDEALQVFLPQRYFQWSDVLLNWAGLAVGAAVVVVVGRVGVRARDGGGSGERGGRRTSR